jgi:hypothetical protein
MSHHHHRRPTLPPSGEGTVVLDIGDGVGALVVHASAELNGVEIELANPGEARTAFVHTEVRERRLPDGSVFAGVFPELRAGEYTLVDGARRPLRPVTITAGRVTEVDW